MRWKQVELQNESETVKKVQRELKLRKQRQKRKRIKKISFRILAIVGVVLFTYGIYRFDQSEYSRYSHFHVRGQKYLSEKEILNNAKLKKNDRIYFHFPKRMQANIEKNEFVKKAEVKLKPFSQTAFINVEEKQALAYDDETIYFEQGLTRKIPKDRSILDTLPYLNNMDDKEVVKNLLTQLPKVTDASLLAISEIEHIPDDFDDMFLKLTMNDGYYVFTSIKTLPLLNNYATIISGVDSKNRCIHILEYGPTDDTHVATAKPCE